MAYQSLCFSTKYLAGHTDLLGGAVSFGNHELGSQIDQMQKIFGNNMVGTMVIIEVHKHYVCLNPTVVLAYWDSKINTHTK